MAEKIPGRPGGVRLLQCSCIEAQTLTCGNFQGIGGLHRLLFRMTAHYICEGTILTSVQIDRSYHWAIGECILNCGLRDQLAYESGCRT